MKGSETIRLNRPPELSEYTINDDNSTSSSSDDDHDTIPQTMERTVSHGLHGFTNMLGFSRSKSSSSINEHRGWNIFKKEKTTSTSNSSIHGESQNSGSENIQKEQSWWRKSVHRSRPSTVPNSNINLFDESISAEENMILSANHKLETMLHDSFENVVDNSASPTKNLDEDSDYSDDSQLDSLREASRIIKERLNVVSENDSPVTPPNEPVMQVHFKPPVNETSIYDYIYESPNAKNTKNIDLMTVDSNSVTFGKFQRIASCLKDSDDCLEADQSIIAVCDYILTLAKENKEKLFNLQSGISTAKEEEKTVDLSELDELTSKLEEIKSKFDACNEQLDGLVTENDGLKSKLKEVIEFNNICKQFFVEYKGQIAQLYQQVNNETSKNETLKEMQERIAKEYESEKNRNVELSESLALSQEVLQDMEKRYLETVNKISDPQSLQNISVLEAENTALKETIEKITKGNNRIVKDYQRERKKVLDLRKQKDSTGKYIDGMLLFQNHCIQFLTQFIMSFKAVIEPSDFMLIEQQLFHVSSFSPLSQKSLEFRSDKELLAQLHAFETGTTDLFQNLINNTLVQAVKKFTIEQNSNSFLTSQLRILRKESTEKDQYIQTILHDTNNLKLKLRKE